MKTVKTTSAADIAQAIKLIGNTNVSPERNAPVIPATKAQAQKLLALLSESGYSLNDVDEMRISEFYPLRAQAINGK